VLRDNNLFDKKDLKCSFECVRLGQKYFFEGNINKAIKFHQKAVRLKPNDAKIRIFLGNAWLKKANISLKGTNEKKINWFNNAKIHYLKAKTLSTNGVNKEWARQRIKEVEHALVASEYLRILKDI